MMSGMLGGMLLGMTKTTISLDSEVRDRLAALAEQHGRPMGEEIAYLIDLAVKHDFWSEVTVGYSHGAGGEVPDDDEFPEYAHLATGQTYPTPPDMMDDAPRVATDRSVA
jgi:predicted transcriptional regulator